MGTRAVVRVQYGKDFIRVYKHSDGYPENILALIDATEAVTGRKWTEDPEYFLANLVFVSKLVSVIDISDLFQEEKEKGREYSTRMMGVGSGIIVWDPKEEDWIDYTYTLKKDGTIEIRDHRGEVIGEEEVRKTESYKKFLESTMSSIEAFVARITGTEERESEVKEWLNKARKVVEERKTVGDTVEPESRFRADILIVGGVDDL